MNTEGNPYEAPRTKAELPEHLGEQLSGPQIEASLRVAQIITAALAIGLLTFTAFSLFSMYQRNAIINWNFSTITIFGLGLAASAIPASFIIPKFIAAPSVRLQADGTPETRVQSLLGQYQSQLIIGLALLEGAGFLNSFALMQENNPTSLLATILSIGMMIVRIPTRSRLQYWLSERIHS